MPRQGTVVDRGRLREHGTGASNETCSLAQEVESRQWSTGNPRDHQGGKQTDSHDAPQELVPGMTSEHSLGINGNARQAGQTGTSTAAAP